MTWQRWGNVVALAATIGINGLANAIPLGGQTTGEISDRYPSLFTPAGFTFSIWGVIYLSLCLFVLAGFTRGQRESVLQVRIAPWFQLSCVANICWILAWHYHLLVVSQVFMFLLLFVLVKLYVEIRTAESQVALSVRVPVSLYLGWIVVASIANLSVLQNAYGFDDRWLSAEMWTLLKLALAGAIGALMIARLGDAVIGGVVSWAALGIASAREAVPLLSGAASTVCLLLLAMLLVQIVLTLGARFARS